MVSLGELSRAAGVESPVSPRVSVMAPAAWRPITPVSMTNGSGYRSTSIRG